MKTSKILSMGAALLALALVASPLWALERAREEGEEATIVGCLTQAARNDDGLEIVEGAWVLSDIENGERILIKGDASLDAHDANHKVEITGIWRFDMGPEFRDQYDDYLAASKVEHLSTTCDAPSNPDAGVGERK